MGMIYVYLTKKEKKHVVPATEKLCCLPLCSVSGSEKNRF